MDPELRRKSRRVEAARIRQNRIITEYVRVKHPVAYSEAVIVYNQLNENYPKKPDLRKTKEFQRILSGESMPPTVYRQKCYPNITDNMQLRIPLLKVQSPVVQSPVEVSLQAQVQSPSGEIPQVEITVQTSEELGMITTVQSPSGEITTEDLYPIDDSAFERIVEKLREGPEITVQTSEELDMITTVQSPSGEITTEDLNPIDDSTFERIVEELREDPTLSTFFQDWDYEDDDCPMW